MDVGWVSALSALAGAATGGFLSLLASWIVNQKQVRAQWLSHDRERREDVYKEFIEAAAKCYGDALLHDKPDIPSLIAMYAKMSRVRILSSPDVVESAQQIIDQIMRTYSEPPKSFSELQAMEHSSLDIIRNFSERCRAEFDSLRAEL